jgi:hypothetical protein
MNCSRHSFSTSAMRQYCELLIPENATAFSSAASIWSVIPTAISRLIVAVIVGPRFLFGDPQPRLADPWP